MLEVGAGNGYLSKQLQDAGVDLLPTDLHKPQDSSYQLGDTRHTAIATIDALQAIRAFHQMDLLWSWPPRDASSGEALQAFQGELLVYIGEQHDGCTGGDLFNLVLTERYRLLHSIEIPTFPHTNDSIGVYRRVSHPR